MRAAAPLERIALPHRLRDVDTLQATWADYRPAVPVTPAGVLAAGLGFLIGWTVAGLLGRMIALPFRRRVPLGWR